ncbi:MerR family transcriptional regulator [Streptomyces sp. NPDC060048]|uniref:MerR family transcriptional regulator n=1 Tax=unclassified Streptomyces TaxID=2593676 RepID=UPI0036C4265B
MPKAWRLGEVTSSTADMLDTTQGFLRAIGDAGLIAPPRSAGGHRRYSRYRLRLAARARELVDGGTPIDAACRTVTLEVRLAQAQRVNAEHGCTGWPVAGPCRRR